MDLIILLSGFHCSKTQLLAFFSKYFQQKVFNFSKISSFQIDLNLLKIEANEATIGFSSKLLSMQTTQAELRIDLIWKDNRYNIREHPN